MKSTVRPSPRRSGRVLAFLALGVLPPAILTGCDRLFHKDVDAGADAAVVVEDAALEAPTTEPVESAPPDETEPPPAIVPANAGTKRADAGVHDAGPHDAAVPVVPVPDAGKIPTPIPSGMRIPTIPSGLRIPSGIPSRFLPR